MDKFNQEHYSDPTPHKALSGIEAKQKDLKAYRPLVYICSPFSGGTDKNILNARKYCRFAVDQGYLPLAPHLLFPQFLDDNKPEERELGMHFGNVLMKFCREMWVFGDEITAGMDTEIRRARWRNYVVRYFDDECKEVTG